MADNSRENNEKNPEQQHYERMVARYRNSSSELNVEKGGLVDSKNRHLATQEAEAAKKQEDLTRGLRVTNNSQSDVQDREENPWKTNVEEPQKNTISLKGLTSSKKMTLSLAFISVCLVVIGALWGLVMGALGLVNFKETALNKISMRTNSVMERVEDTVMISKRKDPMNRNCGLSPLKCRYRGFSDKEIKRYNTRAAEYGWRMESKQKSKYPPFRNVVVFQKVDSSGKVLREVRPEQYAKLKRTDASFAKADGKFYKGKVETFLGKAAKGVWLRTKTFIGKRTTPKGSGDTEESRRQSSIREQVRTNVSGENLTISNRQLGGGTTDQETVNNQDADRVGGVAGEVINDEIQRIDSEKEDYSKNIRDPLIGTATYASIYDPAIDKIDKAGSGLSSVARPLGGLQNVCMVRLLLSAANQARGISQTLQLIRFSIMYVSLADRIKAGDADGDTAEQINNLMTLMTTRGPSGKTGFDSMGYGWVSTGAVIKNSSEDVGKFQNGGPAPGIFGDAATEVLSSREIKAACAVATSKTALAVNIAFDIGSAALGIFTLGAGTAATQAAKQAATEGTEYGVKTIIKKMIQKEIRNEVLKKFSKEAAKSVARGATMNVFFQMTVPPLLSSVARSATNTVVTGDEYDEEPGNAAVSGLGAVNTQVAKAQGMEFISVDEALEQDKISYNTQRKIALSEGINHFDIANKFSFTNKVSSILLPVVSKIDGASSIPSVIGSINGSIFSAVTRSTYAASNERVQYEYCMDDEYSEKNIATDPFCNPQLGMNEMRDPEEVIDYLVSADFLSEDGTPQGEFSDFIEKCINTNSPIGDEEYCTEKGSEKYTMMRSYCLHTSVDIDMNDGEGVGCSPALPQNTSTATNEPSRVAGEVTLADLYKPSESIACAATTRDLGVHDGYHSGVKLKLRLCAVDTIPETGERSTIPGANGKLVVNSRVSGVYSKLADDAKAAGVNVSAAEGFRTMERQQYFWDLYQSGRGNLAARPGYSNHQAGVAVDWSPDVYNWLSQGNADNYGLKECTCGEQWHYSFDGK